ncbi:LRR and NB-ARC domain disease resistance protein, putative [Medicago truncatula]|uniref:LRR and NB-ARC domain disease resistance protein, putative n=1 Tax=Medicago truncatula TaxID=3880 RepID=A0A072UU46_MEDTR|nr:LRR and NB-ARC domain disease resistance protein, putative [Medicago truncatula]
MILSSTCLQRLPLYNIPYLNTFRTDGLPISLKSLCINGCNNLSFLPLETNKNYTSLVELVLVNSYEALSSFPLDNFPKLQSLSIICCDSLESIFISGTSSHYSPTLQSLSVFCRKALRSLPQRMDTLTALEHLILEDIPELKLSFLPPKLQLIHICSKKIEVLVSGGCLQHLTTLSKIDYWR